MSILTYNIPPISLAEFDIGGVLYHARYFHLYEQAREALLEELGSPYPELAKAGYHLAVTESSQKFMAPIFYGDKLRLELKLKNLRTHSLEFEYLIYKSDKCLHHGYTKHAVVQKLEDGFKLSEIPKELKAALEHSLLQKQT